MTTYIDRMKVEAAELDEKIKALNCFLETEQFNGLKPTIQRLMNQQLIAMEIYYTVLENRISLETGI